jgi:phage tail tape-measure protein
MWLANSGENIMTTSKKNTVDSGDTNPDAITGAPGSHPVETGVGAALGGAAAGAAAGAVAGPAGVIVGAAVGAIAGGYAGKAVGESIDPTAEDAYWRENYRNRPYVTQKSEYDHYRPAYQYGWESRTSYQGKSFDDVESELERGWEQQRGQSTLNWSDARHATRDAWDRTDLRPSETARRPK